MELRLTCTSGTPACRRLAGSFSTPRELAFRIREPGHGSKYARHSPLTCAIISTALRRCKERTWMLFRTTFNDRHLQNSLTSARRAKLTLPLQASYTFTS